jgi:EAL domain-containing protein (putative c-di-GMP-specific phosphodiesterase class I)
MFSITTSLIRQAAYQQRRWRKECPTCWPLSVTINISPKEFAREDHLSGILSVLMQHRASAHGIRLEITESQLMEDADGAQRALARISDTGTRIYIDDFGTGYSSLSYLSNFRVDALKIDQSFIRGLQNEKNAAVVRSIISLGQNLGMDVVAEGIETQEQRDYLRAADCEYGQGFYFARPMDADSVSACLGQWFPPDHDKTDLAGRLRRFTLFDGVDGEDLLEIAQICEEVRAESDASVIEQGRLADFLYLIEEGTVGIYQGDDRVPKVILEAPAVFGEMALFTLDGTRTATVRAHGNLRLLALPKAFFRPFVQRLPHLKNKLLELVESRSPTSSR